MPRRERAIVSAKLAIRELVSFQGGGTKEGGAWKAGVGIRIPKAWLDGGWVPGKMVLMSREGPSGETIRVSLVDEKRLLSLIKATEKEE